MIKLAPLIVLALALTALSSAPRVEASFWDGIPIISQAKSLFQAIAGDNEGAKKTQENFSKQMPGVSQIRSAVEAASGDTDAAKKTQEQFLHETIEPVAENTPVVGHIVGGVHMATGNKEKGEQILKGASSNTAALIGGILGGPAGAIAAGAGADALITGVDSAVHGEFRPHGVIEYGDKAAKDELDSGDHFDFLAGLGLEFSGGKKTKGALGKKKGGVAGPEIKNVDGEPRLQSTRDSGAEPKFGSGNKYDPHKIPIDPKDGSHNIETGKKWKSPHEMSAKEFDQMLSDLESGTMSKDFYHVDHWPEPYRSKLQKELSSLSPEHKKHISGRDLKMIVNGDYGKFNCYYCSIARSVGLTVRELEIRSGIKVQKGGSMPHITYICDKIGLKPNHVIKDASIFTFDYHLGNLIKKNEHKKFLIAYTWKGTPNGHMTCFEAWRSSDGKLHQLHKDFQQPTEHHLSRSGEIIANPNARFYEKMPANVDLINLIEVNPEVGSHRRRRRDASGFDLARARASVGLSAELAAKLEPGDFENVVNDADRSRDPTGELTSMARLTGSKLRNLIDRLDSEFSKSPPSTTIISDLYKKLGFEHFRMSKPMTSRSFVEYLDRQVNKGESTTFTLLYWPRGATGMRFLAAKAWKDDQGRLSLLTTDHSKESGSGRFSDHLPTDALWLYSVTVYNVREIDRFGLDSLTPEQRELMAGMRRQADANGHKCGGERRRIIGYVTSWAKYSFTIEQASKLTNAIYAFMEMDSSGRLSLPESRLAKERLVDMILARETHREMGIKFKLSFAVGGWVNSQHFSSVLSDQQSRKFFIDEIERIINTYQFDGVDIDWEYPHTGGATQGKLEDRQNYVTFVRELRQRLGDAKLISIAAAAGQEGFEGFDVGELIKQVDWIGVMTYDFFGAWDSQWGAYVGPLAPLRHASPPGYSGKLNIDWAMKQYACLSASETDKLVMGVPFYGRYWYNTQPGKNNDKFPLFRMAERLLNGSFGGEVGYRQLLEEWKLGESSVYRKHWDTPSSTPWATDGSLVLTYENSQSISEKVKYAVEKNFGGLMIWAVDHDDSSNSLLSTVFEGACNKLSGLKKVNYKCNPLGTEKRWWTWLEDKDKAGQCGTTAPLYKGFYARCDPDDPGYSCCSKFGYCGTGEDFCKCDGCVDYGANPDLLVAQPMKP